MELSPQNFHYDVLYPLYSGQGDIVDSIEQNVLKAEIQIEDGTKELGKAEENKKSSRKKKVVCFSITAVVIIIIVLVLIVESIG